MGLSPCLPLVLLITIPASLADGQALEEPPGDPANFCPWMGEWFPPNPSALIDVSAEKCREVRCIMMNGIARINVTFVGGKTASNCCQGDGRLYQQGETRFTGLCDKQTCTETGWDENTVSSEEVPCPPDSTSVWERFRRRCVTILPVTADFATASEHCYRLGGDLIRPFGRLGQRDDQLREAIGRVEGWLMARGGREGPRWPWDGHPSRLWYNNRRVARSDAVGCLGYRYTDNNLGGWSEYDCSEELAPICAVRPAPNCDVSTCSYEGREREHGALLFQLAPCLNVYCWHGYRVPRLNQTCAGEPLEEPPVLPSESCPWKGALFPPKASALIDISAAKCLEVRCVPIDEIARIDVTFIGGANSSNCCQRGERLFQQGEVEFPSVCEKRTCTATGWNVMTVDDSEVPCPPNFTSVWETWRRYMRRCVTILPVTADFAAARRHCYRLRGDLVRPFGRRGRRDDQLREAIGEMEGWLMAKGGREGPRWPWDGHPSRLWYNNRRVERRNAVGCLGYRYTDNNLGGWSEYDCSEELAPICAVRPVRNCDVSTCSYEGREREHGALLFQLARCLNVYCWHGYRVPRLNQTCQGLAQMAQRAEDVTPAPLLPP